MLMMKIRRVCGWLLSWHSDGTWPSLLRCFVIMMVRIQEEDIPFHRMALTIPFHKVWGLALRSRLWHTFTLCGKPLSQYWSNHPLSLRDIFQTRYFLKCFYSQSCRGQRYIGKKLSNADKSAFVKLSAKSSISKNWNFEIIEKLSILENASNLVR